MEHDFVIIEVNKLLEINCISYSISLIIIKISALLIHIYVDKKCIFKENNTLILFSINLKLICLKISVLPTVKITNIV